MALDEEFRYLRTGKSNSGTHGGIPGRVEARRELTWLRTEVSSRGWQSKAREGTGCPVDLDGSRAWLGDGRERKQSPRKYREHEQAALLPLSARVLGIFVVKLLQEHSD
jgi:hypothetical protein